jgi:alcohol dehydrogenase (NADP+)
VSLNISGNVAEGKGEILSSECVKVLTGSLWHKSMSFSRAGRVPFKDSSKVGQFAFCAAAVESKANARDFFNIFWGVEIFLSEPIRTQSHSSARSAKMAHVNIPRLGFGTARLRGSSGITAIRGAIATGYRHFDTAKVYGNEEILGAELCAALKDGRIESREALFVTSKLWNDDHRPEHVEPACRGSLSRLGLDYIDLYLIHWPCHWRKGTLGCPDYEVDMVVTWKAMESLVRKGLVKYIGVSNFGEELLTKIMKNAEIKPVCNQIELHPRLQQQRLVDFCQRNNIIVTAWSPLAKGSYGSITDNNNIVAQAALKRSISSSELVLLWHLTRNIVAIPRSSNLMHMKDNLNVLKRSSTNNNNGSGRGGGEINLALLSPEEMKAMSELDKGARLTFDFVGAFEETQFPWTWVGKVLYFAARMIWAVLPNRLDFKMPPAPA